MVAFGWGTLIASGFLLVAAGVIAFRWPDTGRRERLGGSTLLVGAAVDVWEEELIDVLGLRGGPLADTLWLGSLLLVLVGAGFLFLSSDR